MKKILTVTILALLSLVPVLAGPSVFRQQPRDPDAVFFSPRDGDVTQALQDTINNLKLRDNYGIVYLASGTYRISGTIHVPPSIRLIGWGETRPQIILSKNAPGFADEYPDDEGNAKYMFWFVANVVVDGNAPAEATSGTFYQGFENIDVKVEDGNPQAVVFRTHYAQHSFIEHCEVDVGKGKAGVFEVGNEMEDVIFRGGEYGIYTRKTSPGWQMTILNTLFEGQRKAAIRSMEAGMTLVRVTMRNVPVGLEIWPGNTEVAFLEDCTMDNVSEAAILESGVGTPTNQLNVLNIGCRKTPVFLKFRENDARIVKGEGNVYQVDHLTYGLAFDSMAAEGEHRLNYGITPAKTLRVPVNDIPALPDMSRWTYITDLGAVGDGQTDNTEVFRKAIAEHDVIFMPQGLYKVSGTLELRPETILIGMSPVSTRIVLAANTPAFSGFGEPVPLLVTPRGGKNILSGFGLDVMGFNYRAVSCKWMAGEGSYMNDVQFSGWTTNKGPVRFTNMSQEMSNRMRRARIVDRGVDESWDNQHWNLWVTDGGGGIFKDIWINNTYGSCGLFVDNTDTPSKIYEMSVEHHLRSEVRFDRASNWRVYALQLEEETREGNDVVPMELTNSRDLFFANFYVFRVISIMRPLRNAVRVWNCRDIDFCNFHNFTQIRMTINNSVFDVNTRQTVRPWEFARLTVTGEEPVLPQTTGYPGIERLGEGFEYAEGIVSDSKGNVFFTEERLRKLYMWNASTGKLTLLLDLPWQPLSLAVDTDDNLLVVVKYYPQPGNLVDGKPETVPILPDSKGTTFAWWGNYGFLPMVYAIDPKHPSASVRTLQAGKPLQRVDASWYATHRWRDLHDFDEACMFRPESYFTAPDGKTMIPQQYDLVRSSSIRAAVPGKPFYEVDEFRHQVKRFDVDAQGFLSNPTVFADRGEHGIATDAAGNVYIGEGDILVYAPDGSFSRRIKTPAGPNSLAVSGNFLYFTTRDAFYRIRIN